MKKIFSRTESMARCGIALVATTLVLTGCAATTLSAQRQAELKAQLETHEYPMSLDAAWPVIVQMLGRDGYPLAGKDRPMAGLPDAGPLSPLGRASETHEIGNGRRELATDWNGASRYRVEGISTGPNSCRIAVFLLRQADAETTREKLIGRDYAMEFALFERLEPPPDDANDSEPATADSAPALVDSTPAVSDPGSAATGTPRVGSPAPVTTP